MENFDRDKLESLQTYEWFWRQATKQKRSDPDEEYERTKEWEKESQPRHPQE